MRAQGALRGSEGPCAPTANGSRCGRLRTCYLRHNSPKPLRCLQCADWANRAKSEARGRVRAPAPRSRLISVYAQGGVRGEGRTRAVATGWDGRGGERAPDSKSEPPSPGGRWRQSPARAKGILSEATGRGFAGREMVGTGCCCECAYGTRWGGEGQGAAGTPAARTPMRSERRNDLRGNHPQPPLQAQGSGAGHSMRACEHAARAARMHFAAPSMPTQAYPRATPSSRGLAGKGGALTWPRRAEPRKACRRHSDVISCQ